MRFKDLDQAARLTLAGSLAAVVSFFLPWFTVRLGLVFRNVSGMDVAMAPLFLQQFRTPAGPLESLLLALFGIVALVCALATLLLIVAPAVSTLREMNPRAGLRFAAAGLVASLLAILLMAVVVGRQVGVTQVTYGAALALVGFGLAVWGWPRAHRLGDDEEGHAEPSPPPGAGA